MAPDLIAAIEKVVRTAPAGWMLDWCLVLQNCPSAISVENIVGKIPSTHNADLTRSACRVVSLSTGRMSWEALGWVIQTMSLTYTKWQTEQQIELLWAGPSPANQIPARRIDQVLYDLIGDAQRDVLLVTFAASKIDRLAAVLIEAVSRHVSVRLILEFEEASEGQLSYDALRAFPESLIKGANIYCWLVEKRERNQAGRPGKLHAKTAVIDDTVVISSANLTDDAFNRNLELGARIVCAEFSERMRAYFQGLIAEKVLVRI
jgi:phosphatidylserine/phosphatidylglycerophosphate/cardiolipin synthase-like enzyme